MAPRLIDELHFLRRARDAAGLQWAEDRLVQMGFKIETKQKVRSYTKEAGVAVAYADPRAIGDIGLFSDAQTGAGAVWVQHLPARSGGSFSPAGQPETRFA